MDVLQLHTWIDSKLWATCVNRQPNVPIDKNEQYIRFTVVQVHEWVWLQNWKKSLHFLGRVYVTVWTFQIHMRLICEIVAQHLAHVMRYWTFHSMVPSGFSGFTLWPGRVYAFAEDISWMAVFGRSACKFTLWESCGGGHWGHLQWFSSGEHGDACWNCPCDVARRCPQNVAIAGDQNRPQAPGKVLSLKIVVNVHETHFVLARSVLNL